MMLMPKQVKKIIDQYGISQAQLGRVAGCQRQSIQNWLAGRNNITEDKQAKISKFLEKLM